MEKDLVQHFSTQAGCPDLLAILTRKLSAPELNTVLLEVFRQKTQQLAPADLLRHYRQNRFVRPAELDPLSFRAFELELLQAAQQHGFTPLELSPLSPLGACSVMAGVPQHNVVSALRGAEITADATNALALESASRRSTAGFPAQPLRFCTAHRHVRAQSLSQPGHTAHFKIFGLTTAGRDTGSFQFERTHLLEHWGFYRAFLQEKLGLPLQIRIKSLAADPPQRAFVENLAAELRARDWAFDLAILQPGDQPYYRILQAKLSVRIGGQDLEIADSGFTDWTQRLSGNRKERFLISGLGSELLFKMLA